LRVLLHLRALPRLIRRRTRRARRPRRRLLLQRPLHVLAFHLLHPRHDPAFRYGQLQHREARLREYVLPQQRLELRGLLARLQLCNVIPVPAALLLARDNRAQVRRKACARLARHNNIVRAARRRVVLVARLGSVRVDRLRGSRNVPAVAADQVVATIKDQSARSVPAREFPRPNQASRSMRASPRRADGR